MLSDEERKTTSQSNNVKQCDNLYKGVRIKNKSPIKKYFNLIQ